MVAAVSFVTKVVAAISFCWNLIFLRKTKKKNNNFFGMKYITRSFSIFFLMMWQKQLDSQYLSFFPDLMLEIGK
jgi:hypothetical protein